MATRVITLSAGTSNVMTTSVTTIHFLLKQSTLKVIKSSFEKSDDKQNITLVVISYEINQTRR